MIGRRKAYHPPGPGNGQVRVWSGRHASPGERYAVVWAKVATADGGPIARINRTGIRLYLSVGGSNPPPSQVTVDSMTAADGSNG